MQADRILNLLKAEYPNAKCALNFQDAWQLLVATILSAQCTDERVNQVTPRFFKTFKNVAAVNSAGIERIISVIRPTGFFNNKAKFIKASAAKIVKDYQGKVPDNMQELLTLPGVARKTANVVLAEYFHKNEGIAVDTHVSRLAQRLGLSVEKDAPKIEQDLLELFKQEDWGNASQLLIHHGRKICKARKPECSICPLREFCPSRIS